MTVQLSGTFLGEGVSDRKSRTATASRCTANGYLPHQFLAEGTNSRTDEYGGSAENRARFLLEVTSAGLAPLGLPYLHVVEGFVAVTEQIRSTLRNADLNAAFSLPATRENLEGLLAAERTDLVAVGRAFIANPDLVQRLQLNAPLNPADESSFYGGTDAGYIDYPALDDVAA